MAAGRRKLAVVITLLNLTIPLSTYEILLIPIPVGSHVVILSNIAEALVQAGHKAHVIKPRSSPIPSQFHNTGVQYISYGHHGHTHFTQTEEFEHAVGHFSQLNSFQYMSFMKSLFESTCREMLTDENLHKELQKSQYDFAIVDDIPSKNCFHIIAHRLDVPYGSFSLITPLDMMGTTMQVNYIDPTLPMFHSKEPSFAMRLVHFVTVQLINFMKTFENEELMKYVGDRPIDLYEMRRRSKLWLVFSEPMVDGAKNYPPNIITVGSITAGPAKPLPDDLQKFADSAQHGLIVVSFGGSLTTTFPDEMLKKLLTGLSSVQYHVVIRLKTKPNCDIGKNIIITKWLPQNDLLGHENTVLFVMHYGMSSIREAVYHGIPMLGFPNQPEQRDNAARIADRNYGVVMDRNEFTSDDLKNTIVRMMTNSTWRDAIKTASRIIKSRRFSDKEAAAYWIEHVIKYGGDHLIPRTTELAWYQIMMYDVMVVITASILFAVYLAGKSCRCCKRACCSKSKHKLH